MQPTTTPAPFIERADFDNAVSDARAAGWAYHDTGAAPTLTDADYDQLVARIAATKQLHPDWDSRGVTTGVASGSTGGAVRHQPPMQSLDKVTTEPEVTQFVQTLNSHPAVVEVKLDGMAVHLDYRDGRLQRAATRGDGITGDDITHQITREPGVAGLPTTLPHPWTGSLRGEIFMTTNDFEQANNARTSYGKTPFVNPRNAVAGSIRKVERTYVTPMSFAAYAISGDDLHEIDGHLERMAMAKALGFTTAAMLTIGAIPPGTSISCSDAAEVQTVIDLIGQKRPLLNYPIDGAVVKVESRVVRNRMGIGSSAPRWAAAFKYPPDTAYSVLRDIEVTVGRTGRAGFRAVIDPVSVGGATISAATLHNVGWIEQQGLALGSRVAVMRAGDVIPRVTAPVGERPEGATVWEPPATCPQCDQPWDTTGQLWRCVTPACSLVSLLTYAASRDVWDIDGLGEEIAAALVEADLVRDIADVFELTVDQIATVVYSRTLGNDDGKPVGRRIGRATAEKLVTEVTAAKGKPLARHITALGIRMTGRRMGRVLATHFRSLDALRAATEADLVALDGVGPEKAQSIFEGLVERAAVIDRLVAAGITTAIEDASTANDEAAPLAGKTVVITGAIPGLNRTEAQEAAEQMGAKTSSSVSARTNILIVGAGTSTGSKLAKAERLPEVRIMPAEEFVQLHQAFLGSSS